MKTIITTAILLSSMFLFSQNKNMSFSLKVGSTYVKGLSKSGQQSGILINYHFFKDKRMNLTSSFLFYAYSAEYNYWTVAFNSDGSTYLKEQFKPIRNRTYGIVVSTQIKLFNLNKKLIPFIQPQISYLREKADNNLQTFGGNPASPDNLINLTLSVGAQYNKRIQLNLYYEYALIEPTATATAIPSYYFGGKLSYLFNINFKKNEVVEEE